MWACVLPRPPPSVPTAVVTIESVVQSCPYGLLVSWMTSNPSAINGPPDETKVVITLTVGGAVGGVNATVNYTASGVSYRTLHTFFPFHHILHCYIQYRPEYRMYSEFYFRYGEPQNEKLIHENLDSRLL